jgi:hypothetical protein
MLRNQSGRQAGEPADSHAPAVRSAPPVEPPAVRSGGQSADAAEGSTAEGPQVRPRPTWRGLLPEVGGLAFCAVLYAQTGALDTTVEGPGPAMYPRLLIGLLALALLVRMWQHVREMRGPRLPVDTDARSEEEADLDDGPISLPRVWQAIAMAVGYVVATLYLGWILATFAFLVLFLFLSGKRNLLVTVPLAAGLSVGLAYVFVKVVYIALPTGVGAFDLFTVGLLQALGAL